MNAREGGAAASYFHLFAYGTLLSGGAASLLAECERIGPARVAGTLYNIDDGYPALVLAGGGWVQGEVWRCPTPLLDALDQYEDVAAGVFRRVAVRAGGRACWTYVAGPALARRLTPLGRMESGRWVLPAGLGTNEE